MKNRQLPKANLQVALLGPRAATKQFAVELARNRQLPAEDLVIIAQKMLEMNDPAEKQRLEDELTRGFYGD